MGFGRILALIVTLSFALGFVFANLVMQPTSADLASPLTSFFVQSPERNSPYNWVSEEDILVYDDRVVLNVENPYWSKFANTNSMDPLLDEDANAIQIRPESPRDVHIGDVISYRTPHGVIIHRVTKIDADDQGWYAIARGDNNAYSDPDRIRFSQIERVLIAVIY